MAREVVEAIEKADLDDYPVDIDESRKAYITPVNENKETSKKYNSEIIGTTGIKIIQNPRSAMKHIDTPIDIDGKLNSHSETKYRESGF